MKNLLIIAHGSRREQSNTEIRALAEQVAANLPLHVDDVSVAFLEFSSPTIHDVINSSLTKGTQELIVLPYFLSAGNHVVKDIPHELDQVIENWPGRKITILPHIGGSQEMVKLITSTLIELQGS